MQKVVHRLRLDLERPGIQAVSYMRKGDTLSRRMVLSLYEQGKPYRIEDGVTARIRGKKSDGTILYNDCFVQDNCIVVDVTTQMLAALGEVECELNLYGTSNAILTTPRFSIVVEDVLLADGQLESQNEFTAMTKATEEMKTLYNTVDEAYKSGAFKGEKGDKGDDGAPGKDGTDGKDGAQGKDGSPGADGISPTLSISDIPGGHRVTITDASGEKSFDVLNGDAESDKLWKPTVSADGTISWTKTTEENAPTPQNIKGAQGSPGTPGADGKPGADGVSPSIAVTQITGGHHVSVTDAAGTKGFDVLDGAKGDDGAPGIPGSPGAAGPPGADGTTFTPSVDVNGDLSWTNDGGKPNPATVNIKGPKGDKGEKGDGSDITVDTNLDINSTNPVQNKAVTLAISGKADASHIHTADQIIEGVFPIVRGGTEASTAAGARANLDVPLRPKLLWSGSILQGSAGVSVPGIKNYRILLVETETSLPMLAYSNNGESFICSGAIFHYYVEGSGLFQRSYTVEISSGSEDNVTIGYAVQMEHRSSSNHTAALASSVHIYKIYGLVLASDIN